MSANKPTDTQQVDARLTSAQQQNRVAADIEEVATGGPSFVNALLWLFAIISLISATILPGYLQDNWQPASSTWVRLGVVVGLVVLGLVFLLLTKQGRGFFKLLSDARTELRRVTWPTKDETFEYTWKVLLLMMGLGFLIWLLDAILNPVIGMIIG